MLSNIEINLLVLVTNFLSQYIPVYGNWHNSVLFGNFVCQCVLHIVTHRCYKTDMMKYCGIAQGRKPINIVKCTIV